VSGQFRSVDLLATLLELLGQPAVATSGVSRARSLLRAEPIPDSESYAESLFGQLHFGWAPLRALRGQGWKYIHAPRAELYDLREDPGETRNRLDDRSQVATAMRQRLLAQDSKPPPAAAAAIDPDAAERLAALGYVGGALFVGTPSGVDPKDTIGEYQRSRRDTDRGMSLFFAGDYAGAVRALQPLIAPTKRRDGRVVERDSYNVSLYLGRSLRELRRFDEAAAALQEALRLSPVSHSAWAHLARAHAGAGRLKEALSALERGLARAPRNPDLQMKGRMLLRREPSGEARAVLEAGAAAGPEEPPVFVDLSTFSATGRHAAGAGRGGEKLAPEFPRPSWRVEVRAARSAVRPRRATTSTRHFGRPFLSRRALLPRRDPAPRRTCGGCGPLLERLLEEAPDYPRGRELLAQARLRAGPAPEGEAQLRLVRVRDRAKAEDALRRARAGEDFATLARELSEDPSASRGGDLGLVRVADLAEWLRTAALPLAPGELSALVETPDGFVLLKRER
jgi:parvulin-like peptidyl-prolyl isomerase